MKLTFRWYGNDDPVTLEKISQIPTMSGIVSAVYDIKPGGIWSEESISQIKDDAGAHGLEFEVVESVPVPEDIKLGNEKAPRLIENYCENIRRLGRAGVKCVCYNFMPVFDWLRSELEHNQADGANALAYDEEIVLSMDPLKGDLALPGWDASYTNAELKGLINAYKKIGEEGLWKNVETFLKSVIPVAKESGVNMAIHPDDPPWGMFGLPRIITNKKNIQRFLDIVPETNNGITLCTGSLGANPENDLIDMVESFARRIHFVHLRNIKSTGYRRFEEVGHPTECGSIDIYGVAKALVKTGFDRYVRPDHGRMIWGEKGRYGYGLFDRALGATYIAGLFEAIEKGEQIMSKTIVITGAGGVLCSEFSRFLATKGAKIALLDLNLEAAQKVSEEINKNGGASKAYKCNVLEKSSIEEVHKQVLEDFGKCDILINGAGGNNAKCTTAHEEYAEGDENTKDFLTFFNIDEKGFDFVFALNLKGMLMPSQIFMADMIGRKGCSVLNISSMNAYRPLTKIPAYSAAKAAVSNFTQWLAVHFAKEGIRVNAIAPGFFVTNQNRSLLFNDDNTPTPRTNKILSATPMGRFGESEELLGTVEWLLDSQKSGFVTGVTIPIDGGFSAYSGV